MELPSYSDHHSENYYPSEEFKRVAEANKTELAESTTEGRKLRLAPDQETVEQAEAVMEYRIKLHKVGQMIGKILPFPMELRPRRGLEDIPEEKRGSRKFLKDL
ncbi:hypothetical protein KW801_02790 [Candidatus Saccharibacteria bacterium]|nr:hypothetical protein [Candidatus Saccharibacteria bacterium]